MECKWNIKKVLDLTLNKNHNLWIDNMDQYNSWILDYN